MFLLFTYIIPSTHCIEEPDNNVTLYNARFEKIDSGWEYDGSGKMVSLSFKMNAGAVYTFAFTDDPESLGPGLTSFREAVDKSIEWAAVAKENKVQTVTRAIGEVVRIPYLFNRRYTPNDAMLVMFFFQIIEFEGNNETVLGIQYDRRNPRNDGLCIVFQEKDFVRLKNILSDESLEKAKNEQQEKDKQKDLFQ